MNTTTIGIPKAFFYYDEGIFLEEFFKKLGFNVIVSKDSSKEIYDMGEKISNDEMCTSLKIFLGHIEYLKNKCDYIVNLNINNYGLCDQGCTNYIALYELIKNKTNLEVLNIEIDYLNYKTIYKQIIKLITKFNIEKGKIKQAYMYAKLKQAKYRKEQVINNTNKLFTKKKKILLAGHSYNIHDKYLTNEIIKYLKTKDYEIIYSDFFDYEKVKNESKKLTNNLYWKKNKEYIGAIKYSEEYVDLILTISTFPCSNDLLVNDFIKNKIKKPILNLIIDDINSMTGIITRLESFIDINE